MFNSPSEYVKANEFGEYEVAQGITATVFKQILVRNFFFRDLTIFLVFTLNCAVLSCLRRYLFMFVIMFCRFLLRYLFSMNFFELYHA